MGKFLVTYDLCKPVQDYTKLISCIKLYASCKITESCWLIVTSQTAKELCTNLCHNIDSNDRIMVAALTGEASWLNLIASTPTIKEFLS